MRVGSIPLSRPLFTFPGLFTHQPGELVPLALCEQPGTQFTLITHFQSGNTQASLYCTSTAFRIHHHKPLWKGVSKPSKDLRVWGDIVAWKQDIRRSHTPASTQFTFWQNMWENLVPPFNIYCGGTSIISGGPSGHSVTHPPGKWHSGFKWDKTFASGISISKLNMHMGAVWRCYVRLQPPPPHLRQEIRLKRDSERGHA